MRREGRVQGKVRSCTRIKDAGADRHGDGDGEGEGNAHGPFKCFPLKAGSSKPTNHSKFTGKCRRAGCRFCHLDPPCKSRTKSKGCRKHSSPDLLSSYRLCLWRVADQQFTGLKFAGQSASDFINFFTRDDYSDSDDDDSIVKDEEEEEEAAIQILVQQQSEEEIHVPVQKQWEGVINIPVLSAEQSEESSSVKDDVRGEFSTCESDSWTTGFSDGESEDWCILDPEDTPRT